MSEAEKIIEDNAGIKVNLTESLANMVVERFIGTLDDSILENTFEEMRNDYINNFDPDRIKIRTKERKSSYGSWKDEETYLGRMIRETLGARYTALVIEEANKYMETPEFKAALSQMVADVIAYALEGYKKDMIDRLKERLVGNAYTTFLAEDGVNIDDKIRDAINAARNHNYLN